MWRLCTGHPGELHLGAELPVAPRVFRVQGVFPVYFFLVNKPTGGVTSLCLSAGVLHPLRERELL